ncbi:MAG: inositol monophosphatase [Desulfovibrionaceae bacterium]|nr:inositol monophosphatase [Desulfovibrionaceae bacterium]
MDSSLLNKTLAAAETAGEIIREHWQRPRDVRYKGRFDLVTKTDAAVEAHLQERLKEILPEVGFMGEESAHSLIPDGDCWIVDPVDGTTNFVHGIPFVAVSIALWQGGAIRLGIVTLPMLDERFYAEKGQGAYRNGQPLRVSGIASCEQALLSTGSPAYDIHADRTLRWLGAVLPRCQGVRRCGSAAADLAYVAAGRYEAFYSADLKPWDVAAGWLLVEEAGGRVTNIRGEPLRFGDIILASNGRVHQELVDVLGE